MKKKDFLLKAILYIVPFAGIAYIIVRFIQAIIKLVFDIIDLVNDLSKNSLYENLENIGFTVFMLFVICFVIFLWDKRDDLFYFIASILSKPSEYFYKKRKKQLINYRNEIRELLDSINYFTNIDSKEISKDDFWKFADDIARQNKRLEQNRKLLEKQDNKFNILIQLFILCCGVFASLFL